jgi:hypothetical protein
VALLPITDGRRVGCAFAGLLHGGPCYICSLAWVSSRSDALAVIDSHGRLCVLAAAGGVLERLQLMDMVRTCCSLLQPHLLACYPCYRLPAHTLASLMHVSPRYAEAYCWFLPATSSK